jgi:hypothetical protein
VISLRATGFDIPTVLSLWGHLKEYVYAIHPRIVVDIVTRLQGVVTTVDASMIQRAQENVAQ